MVQIKPIKNKPEIISISSKGKKAFIEWKEAEGAEKYIIKRSRKSDCEFKKIAEVPFGTVCYEDTSISAEGVYWYQIFAHKNMPQSKPLIKKGEPQSVIITTITSPILKSIENTAKNGISFSWEKGENVDGYVILRRHSFMKGAVKIALADKHTFSFTDNSFTPGPTYYYSVQGYVGDGDTARFSLPSNELCSSVLSKTEITEIKRKHFKKVLIKALLTSGAQGYILFTSKSKTGEFKEVARSDKFDSFTFLHKGAKGEKGAFYSVCPYKTVDEKEIRGPICEPVYVKYKM